MGRNETEAKGNVKSDSLYLHIDSVKTGRRLERLIRQRGYSVRDIQCLLRLSCPQPVYRWMRGQILPSVEHLFVLAKLLQVHMEELLVPLYEMPGEAPGAGDRNCPERLRWRRMTAYSCKYLYWKAA